MHSFLDFNCFSRVSWQENIVVRLRKARGTMAFDDRKTKPLIVVGCLAFLCGLAAPVASRLFGVGWSILAATPPVVVWVVLEWLWRREDRARHRAQSAAADRPD
jgi:hypothetical protein